MTEVRIWPASLAAEDTLRRAVATRDARYDGRFVYAVLTTGVYCRPSCASRAAKPANVRFFLDPTAAEAAGFRACKRCQPHAAREGVVSLMQDLARYIDTHADEPLSLARLAAQVHWSPAHVQRTFKAVLGVSPKAYQDAARLRRFKGGLQSGRSVLAAVDDAGFQSTSRVYGQTARNLGMSPSKYRTGGAGETIAFAFRDTALGPLLMAATDRGVCFAQFGRDERALVAQLRAEFPKAKVIASSMTHSPELDAWIEAFEAHIAGNAPRPELSLDLRGTAFQIRIWQFLLKTPAGRVTSYQEVAAGIGAPKAVRAAASACAANRIAVLVPCHRVLRGDGGLGGYRWGLDRKRVLLEREHTSGAGINRR